MTPFAAFLDAHPLYADLYRQLDRKLALAAITVHTVHGDRLGPVADAILAYAAERYGSTLAQRYIDRTHRLAELQRRFDRDPRPEQLGDPNARIPREDYHIALLLSIVFTNHRFEIFQVLDQFLASLPAAGRLAAIGSGTGYEILRAAHLLSGWRIESYDLDPSAETETRRLLQHFSIDRPVTFGRELSPGPYDAIIACELLEHLADPAAALRTWRSHLRGSMFVTMAVNIAQEDHVFLYPDLTACRRQLQESGLATANEWIAPQTAWPPGPDRESEFRRGNYIAIVQNSLQQSPAVGRPAPDRDYDRRASPTS